jgi:hypothetical protein
MCTRTLKDATMNKRILIAVAVGWPIGAGGLALAQQSYQGLENP